MDINEFDALPFAKRPRVENTDNHKIYTTEILVELQNHNGEVVPIHALLDTGTSSTIILQDFVAKGRSKSTSKKRINWKIDNFITNAITIFGNYKLQINSKIPAYSQIREQVY